ncbi:S-layer homology domain-containing protein [Leptolyngbya sp. FACHB-671]|uniref:S-layer homology domain-containing protein n=1 Tax=Leptolyngbya sp. FACHB-671 TaxID=2692812 RepID=UPI00168322AF|nr:S-layer homology domain-containing protein [Leptolyngbya sp. FACHB-671]MBD2071644.1 S-layer homology domain-containing protein [Leptolyngbya sp. FACHB-671]
MLPLKRLPKRLFLLGFAVALLPLASCANSPLGETLQRSLAADPQLEENPVLFGGTPTPEATPDGVAELPANFPAEIPRYPGAELVEVIQPNGDNPNAEVQTRWQTSDPIEQVRRFYQEAFASDNWNLDQSVEEAIAAARDRLRVTVAPVSNAATLTAATPTEFTLQYAFTSDTAASSEPTNSPRNSASDNSTSDNSASDDADETAAVPQPGDPDFIGPLPPADFGTDANSNATARPTSQRFSDLDQAPEELRQYVTDLAELGVFGDQASNEFKPNQEITRREYARWLVAANNLIYGDRPASRIRLGNGSSQPAFQDVPRNDPDFAAIQGLAEAGLIPSPLSGDSTTVTFRPDAPLTRENLILWKMPIDTRQTLPNASLEAVQQTWGFQDTARIDPKALRAVLADFQNGELSNIRRAFGYTTLFQPKKTVTRAEATAVLWYFGIQGEGLSAKDALQTEQRTEQQTERPPQQQPASQQSNQQPNQPSGSQSR